MLKCPKGRLLAPCRVHVNGQIAAPIFGHVDVQQEFVHCIPGEVVFQYSTPVPAGAVVVGMRFEMNGVVTVAVVKERAAARAAFEQAIAAGKSAQLLEEKRADIFTVFIGCIPEGTVCTVLISYMMPMTDDARLILPMFVAPRYHPASERDPIRAAGRVATEKAGVTMRFSVISACGQFDLLSVTHALVAAPDAADTVTATLDGLDRDVELLVRPRAASREPTALVELCDTTNSHAVMVTLMPDITREEEPVELVLVVDRSGSMSGCMQHAKAALNALVQKLEAHTMVNILSFGTSHAFMWPKALNATPENKALALKHIEQMDASLGGTELASALQALEAVAPVLPRQVIVLTDGAVTNTEEVFAIVKNAHKRMRFFALGIGHGVSQELVRGIAQHGGGTFDFVLHSQNIETYVLRMLSLALQPELIMTCVWNYEAASATVIGSLLGYREVPTLQQAPCGLIPVHSNRRLTVFAIVPPSGRMPISVTMHATTPSGLLSTTVSLPANMLRGQHVHQMAAHMLVRDLLDGKTGTPATPEAIKQAVVRLAVQYSIASPHTSFVAVRADGSETEVKITDETETISSSGTSKSASMGGPTKGGTTLKSASMGETLKSAGCYLTKGGPTKSPAKSVGFGTVTRSPPVACDEPRPPREVWTSAHLANIASRQTVYGYFTLSPMLMGLLCVTVPVPAEVGSDTVWVTALTVVVLTRRYINVDATNDDKKSSVMVATRVCDAAVKWLKGQPLVYERLMMLAGNAVDNS